MPSLEVWHWQEEPPEHSALKVSRACAGDPQDGTNRLTLGERTKGLMRIGMKAKAVIS